MARVATIHYGDSGTFWPYCGVTGYPLVSLSMRAVTCKRCLAKIKKDEVIK